MGAENEERRVSMNSRVALITRCALFAAVTALTSQIAFPLGGFPFSMGIFGVMMCGALLSPTAALLSQTAYLLLGAVGLPVFASFQGGLQHILGPTGGFLIAYPLVALIVSLLCRNGALKQILGYGVALCACYLFGAGWYALSGGVSFLAALGVTVLPFIIPDVIKAFLCALLSGAIGKRIKL